MAINSCWYKHTARHVLMAFGLFALGILLGHFTSRTNVDTIKETASLSRQRRSMHAPCKLTTVQTQAGRNFDALFKERSSKKHACVNSRKECMGFGLPRNYNAYHLDRKSILIDGKVDDDAWAEVPWSDLFVDIRSEVYPQPIYDTKFKLRWDDNNLYIASVLQDNHLWATKTSNDSELWSENSFSLLIAADDSLFNYKQIDVNVLGTVTDLLMKKSYYDAPGQLVHNLKWDSNATVGVYTPGTINTPGDRDQYWSVEISVPFETLAIMTNRVEQAPNNNEVWFLQFARTQHVLRLTKDGQYEIAPNISGKWWAWQPSGAINLHLQDRWGLVQFKRTNTDRKFEFQNWHIYKALFDVLEAMKVFKAKNGVYAKTLEELDIPPYLLSRTCVDIPEISMRENRTQADFDINVRSMVFDFPPAYIRSDKFVTML